MRQPKANLCPQIDKPCQQLPHFDWGQKRAFCDLCGKNVHNLSAMTVLEQQQLFNTQARPCIRYARLIPAVVMLLGTSGISMAQDSEEDVALEPVQIRGGVIASRPILEPMFLQSELAADPALDEANKGETNENH